MSKNTIIKKNAKNKAPVAKPARAKESVRGNNVVADYGMAMKYHKESACEFSFKLGDADLLGSSTTKQYNLMLKCDGYGTAGDKGTFIDLGVSDYRLINPTPYTMYVRMQRPLGFVDDVSSIGAWEPLGEVVVHRVKANSTKRLHIGNNSTTHMTPRQVSRGVQRYVHLVSFSIQTDFLADSGVKNAQADLDKEVGLIFESITKYTCYGGDIGTEKSQWLLTSDKLMDFVHSGPTVPMRIDSLTSNHIQGLELNIVGLQCAGTIDGITCKFVARLHDNSTVFALEPNQLDKNTIYQLEHPTLANYWAGAGFWNELTLGGFLKWSGGKWYVAQPTVQDNGIITWNYPRGSATGTYTSDYVGGQRLTPYLDQTVSVQTNKVRGVVGISCKAAHKADLTAHTLNRELGDGWFEKFIDGIVVVIKVTKLVGDILGVVGLMATPYTVSETEERIVSFRDCDWGVEELTL